MYQPLADELRPTTLDDVYGQEEILGEGRMLRRMIESGRVPNLIFYGPSGTGKTTVARETARNVRSFSFSEEKCPVCISIIPFSPTISAIYPPIFCSCES